MNNTFSHLLLDHCFAFGLLTVAFWPEEVFWRRGLLLTYFCPTLDLPLSRNAKHMYRAMISLSSPSRGETIYRWYWGTEASIRFTVRSGLESIRICLSEIIWLNLHRIRFCPICFYLHVWRGNRSIYKLNHLEYFVHFSPTYMERNKLKRCRARDDYNFTTIRYFSLEFSLTFIALFQSLTRGCYIKAKIARLYLTAHRTSVRS